jgi:hypothetical protein
MGLYISQVRRLLSRITGARIAERKHDQRVADREINMVALFAFAAGLYYDLPLGYFLLGFICLLLD